MLEPMSWALVGGVALAGLVVIIDTLRVGAPPMPSSGRARRAALELLPEGPPRTAMELGAGWGGLAFALAQARPDWRVIAVEAALLPWLFCRIRARLSPLDNLEVRRGDLFAMDLSGVDLFTCYLLPDAMARLQQKLLDQGRPGAHVVSVGFGLRGWTAERQIELPDLYRTPVYRYRVPA